MRAFTKRCAGALAALLFSCTAFAQIGYLGPIVGSGGGFITGTGTFTGQIKAPDGTPCTAPSYAFASSTNSGFAIAASNLYSCVGGVQSMAVSSSSLFTVGTIVVGNGGINNAASTMASDAADTLALRRTTNAQTFRVYNTFTDASNYARFEAFWAGTALIIRTAAAGTGTIGAINLDGEGINFRLASTSAVRWTINTSGHLTAGLDNTYDIGAAGSARPRTGYFGTSLVSPVLRSTQTTVPTCTSNCGTSPSIVGGDTAGIVTMGASGVPASGWVVTFNGTWAVAPSCVVQSALTTMVVGKMPIAVQTTTTTMTVTTNGTAPATSDKYAYHCIGVS